MIHLVNMPFLSLTHPTLAPGLIKAQLTRAGMPSRVFNLNLDFAQRIGFGGYEMMALFKGVETQVGEWLFAEEAWGGPFGPSEDEFLSLCGDELESIPHVKDPRAWLRMIRREVVPAYLRECLARLRAAGEIRVVGFSCTFFQTVASLALGRLLKREHPSAKVVYGGACFHGEMGRELMRAATFVDAMSTGEADDVLVPLFRALREGRPPSGLQGILYRDGGPEVIAGPSHTPVSAEVIANNPTPDFDDFFADARRVGLTSSPEWQKRLLLPFESSRGCWWGEKHHCTFCGLNGEGMQYRARSGDSVYEELCVLSARYPLAHRFQSTDNILAMGYFKDLLPRLCDEPIGDGIELFYSVKANMNRAKIAAMAAAGIAYTQPGIESLSDHLLDLMRKGVSALQNVFYLRCCREHGIEVYWNNLIRVPGESAEDYAQMEAWIPRLVHLRPPFGGAPEIECHRFSPYFFEQGRWNSNLRPRPWYAGLFPADRVDHARVAYYFEADWKDTLAEEARAGTIRATLEWNRIWRESPELPRLSSRPTPGGGLRIEDTRRGALVVHELDAVEARIYRAIDEPANLARVRRELSGTPEQGLSDEALRAALEALVAADLALTDRGCYLALALPETVKEAPFALRRGRLRRITNQRPRSAPAQIEATPAVKPRHALPVLRQPG